MRNGLPAQLEVLDEMLDTAHPPVPRLRIMSEGLARNHTLKTTDPIAGTAACLACGNCVDACPVVASKPDGTMFVRTSMLLENVVSDECRRCYRCIAACPQVEPPLKDYARNFRRVERGSHWTILAAYIALFCTGVLINHWGDGLPKDLRFLLGIAHRVFAVALLAAPIAFLLLDPHHFAMAVRKAWTWTAADRAWWGDTVEWLKSRGRAGRLKRGAFNPGQRLWYLYVLSAITIFAVTGVTKWIGPDVLGKGTIEAATWVHVGVAIVTDVLLLLHVYLKFLLPQGREIARGLALLFRLRRERDAVPVAEVQRS